MCGICGIALKQGKVPEQALVKMTAVLRHRGPDGEGIRIDGNVGMGHRRLSIIDIEGGKQPMSNSDDTVRVSYNGEIYNHADLRRELIRLGHDYRTRSDTETLLHLYEEKGTAGVGYLRGMFAYSLWDETAKQLILVRDRLGIKPLYYAFSEGNLIWASEIKSILRSGYIRPALRPESLPEYLANRFTAGPYTLFQDIYRLQPGHMLLWRDGLIRMESYWRLPSRTASRDPKACVEEFRRLFEESVRLRLMSDVPLGMFLSGGIDSSAISAVMSGMIREPVKTFSVAFSEREANEFYYARKVARLFKTEHHEVMVSPEAFFAGLPSLIWHEDEPIAFPSSVPLYFLSELARSHVKVVLTGEGSDELLGGYAKYRKAIMNMRAGEVYARFPGPVRALIRDGISGLNRGSAARRKLTRTFLYLDPGIEGLYFDNFSVFSRERLRGILCRRLQREIDSERPYAACLGYYEESDGDLLERILYTDIHTYLQELLMKQDQMSMAASLESRVPFLDHRLVEFAMSLPSEMKLTLRDEKYILKKAMEGILPREILYRKKMGFPVPIGKWFRDGTCRDLSEILTGERARSRNFFDHGYVGRLLYEHQSGIQDHAERLWSLVNFELWLRIFIDGEEINYESRADEYSLGKNRTAASS